MPVDWERSKRRWLERYGLQAHEEWPLFGVEKYLSAAGPVWVRVTSLPPLDRHPDGLRRLLGEIRRLEYRLEAEGIVGWLQAIRKGNWKMRHCTELIGAELYAETPEHWHFRKVADSQRLPKTVREVVGNGGLHHGTA